MKEGNIKVQKDNDGFELESRANGSAGYERLQLKVDLKAGFNVQLTLRHREDRIDYQLNVELQFLCLVGLKEGEQAKDISCAAKNRTAQQFNKMAFNEPAYSNYSSDKGRVHKFEFSTKDGKFRAMMEMTGDFDPNATGSPQPEPVTIQIRIKHFAFQKEDKYLGLKMEINSNVIIKVKKGIPGHDGTHGEFVETPSPSENKDEELGSMFLALNNQATVDGVQKNVMSAISDDDEGGEEISVVYPRGESIQQDLELGLEPANIVLRGDPLVFGAGIGAAVAVFALTDKRILALLSRKK